MRIRRRPQAQQQAPPPYLEQQPSDPFAAPHPPPNAVEQRWELPLPVPGDEAEQGAKRIKPTEELHSRRPDGDPDAAALPPRPQGGNVVGRSTNSGDDEDDPPVHGHHGGAQRQGAAAAAADGHTHTRTHKSLENAHRRDESERPVMTNGAGERLVIPALPVEPVDVKEGIKSDRAGGAKKRRRGPPVLMEGSRCSRVNGRGWRCSQPTLVGYSLCEHHLGKGRQRSTNGGGGRGVGAPKLGRTEPSSKNNAVPLSAVTAAAHNVSDLPSLHAAALAAEVD